MQSTEGLNKYVAILDSMLKSWGPLFAFMFITTAVAVLFLYREWWPLKKKELEHALELANSREVLLHSLIKSSQERADKLIKDNYEALAELTQVFQTNMERLFAQGATNTIKLDAILHEVKKA